MTAEYYDNEKLGKILSELPRSRMNPKDDEQLNDILKKLLQVETLIYFSARVARISEKDELGEAWSLVQDWDSCHADLLPETSETFILWNLARKLSFSAWSWKRELSWYESLPPEVRAFDFADGKIAENRACVYAFEAREREWQSFALEPQEPSLPKMEYAENGNFHFCNYDEKIVYHNPASKGNNFKSFAIGSADAFDFEPDSVPAPDHVEISLNLDEIAESACEEWQKDLIRNMVVYDRNGESVKTLRLGRRTHQLGMVGSGKSVLMKAEAIHLARQGKKVCIIVSTKNAVLETFLEIRKAFPNSTPLISPRKSPMAEARLFARQGEALLSESLPEIFSSCQMLGILNGTITDMGVERPCFSFKKEKKGEQEDKCAGKSLVCPSYGSCPLTKMQRDCLTSGIVITTPQALTMTGTALKGLPFFRYCLEKFDFVFFDECDLIQNVMDVNTIEEINFNWHATNSWEISEHFKKDYRKKSHNSDAYNNVVKIFADNNSYLWYLGNIVEKIEKDRDIFCFFGRGQIFTLRYLLEKLAEKDAIPEKLKEMLLLIARGRENFGDDEKPEMELEIISHAKDVALELDETAAFERRKVISLFREKTDDGWLAFALAIMKILDGLKALKYNAPLLRSSEAKRLQGIPSVNPKNKSLKFLPESYAGHLYGFKMDAKEKTVKTVSVDNIGRIAMNMPWLLRNPEGKGIGPSVVLFSASSHLPESTKWHVHADVDYIIKSSDEKLDHMRKTRWHFPDRNARKVSGTFDLRKYPERSFKSFFDVYRDVLKKNAEEGKNAIMIVNSHAQARAARDALKKLGIAALRPAILEKSSTEEDSEDTIEAPTKFAGSGCNVLIAPAASIARGHNITLPDGSSYVSVLYFPVRPMINPYDSQEKFVNANGVFVRKVKDRLLEEPDIWKRHKSYVEIAEEAFRMAVSEPLPVPSILSDEEKDSLIANQLVGIYQAWGRMARTGKDISKAGTPEIWFMDGSFVNDDEKSRKFDFLEHFAKLVTKISDKKEISICMEPFITSFLEAYNARNKSKNPQAGASE